MTRREAWAPVGKDITGSKTVDEALQRAELDFDVVKNPVFNASGEAIPNWFATTRTDDNSVLGMVGNRYSIVQNRDAFNFVDNLIGEGVEFEKGGIWRKGSAIWVQAKLPDTYKILGDDVEAHVVFVNSHDGKGSVKVCMVPNRLFCSNQLNIALKNAARSWSAVHSEKIESRIRTAQETLGLASDYMSALELEANRLAQINLDDNKFMDIINRIYPVDNNASARKITNIDEIKTGLMDCVKANDNWMYKNTAWGKLAAVQDYFDHAEPQRTTSSFNDKRWENIVNGHNMVDTFYNEIKAIA